MTKLTVENVYTRHKAMELTKRHFWKLLGMMSIAFGIPFVLTTVTTTLIPTSSASVYSLILILLMLVFQVLSIGLTLGLLRTFIDLCRGNENVTVGSVFQHMPLCLKGFGLSLWIGLKTVLWALPVYVPLIFMTMLVVGNQSAQTSEIVNLLFALLPIAAMVLVFVLVVPAALRYMLSNYILADNPDTGVFECVRQSKDMMKGHKWQAFKLAVPVLLVMYAVLLVASVAVSAAAAFLGSSEIMLTIMGLLMFIVMLTIIAYYGIRLYMCYCIFYLNRVKGNTQEEPAEAPVE